ncbi:2'-5' RNA ligase family protein [Clostridium sp. YIM B02515]|uniref:2'-5' RNA ligase family protein n=1 Tax=Clostridium rhizosphaerae TaxID=2803861 RepID=A0ABS1TFZ7_9CLOT|nr:2'-5' RNA ligase family protein [Clostridium rhizosphaerae]MBL4938297.1 2'-5' RNA ligase family protein [Clostridium rhizosphaerae]
MYAVAALFDTETEKCIKNLWNGLSDKGISNYGQEAKDRRAHITIADYNNLDKNSFIELAEEVYKDKNQIEISLSILGTFVKSGTLFVSAAITTELHELHKNYHDKFAEFNDDPNSFYLPGKWVPHCTIASRLNDENMLKAFDYCSKELKMIKGKITEIALLEFKEFNEAGVCINAPIIYSKKLK